MTNLPCSKCQKDTPHRCSGTATRDADGWTTQPMSCAICATEVQQREPPGIVYELVGGISDGRTVSGAEAEAYYRLTSNGEAGRRFTLEHSDPPQTYQVLHRRVLFGEVLVQAKAVNYP